MADTTALKNRIRAAIKANDNQEITGPVLQQALLDMVDELNGATETEADARQNGDSTLQQSITAEKNRAEGAEAQLNNQITDLHSDVTDLQVRSLQNSIEIGVNSEIPFSELELGTLGNAGDGINIPEDINYQPSNSVVRLPKGVYFSLKKGDSLSFNRYDKADVIWRYTRPNNTIGGTTTTDQDIPACSSDGQRYTFAIIPKSGYTLADLADVKMTINRVNTLWDNVTDLQGDVTDLQGDVTDLQGDVTDLQGDVTDLQGDVTDLQGDVTDLQGDVTDLQVRSLQNSIEIGANSEIPFSELELGTMISPNIEPGINIPEDINYQPSNSVVRLPKGVYFSLKKGDSLSFNGYDKADVHWRYTRQDNTIGSITTTDHDIDACSYDGQRYTFAIIPKSGYTLADLADVKMTINRVNTHTLWDNVTDLQGDVTDLQVRSLQNSIEIGANSEISFSELELGTLDRENIDPGINIPEDINYQPSNSIVRLPKGVYFSLKKGDSLSFNGYDKADVIWKYTRPNNTIGGTTTTDQDIPACSSDGQRYTFAIKPKSGYTLADLADVKMTINRVNTLLDDVTDLQGDVTDLQGDVTDLQVRSLQNSIEIGVNSEISFSELELGTIHWENIDPGINIPEDINYQPSNSVVRLPKGVYFSLKKGDSLSFNGYDKADVIWKYTRPNNTIGGTTTTDQDIPACSSDGQRYTFAIKPKSGYTLADLADVKMTINRVHTLLGDVTDLQETVSKHYPKINKPRAITSNSHQGFSMRSDEYYGNSRLSSYKGSALNGFDFAECDIVWTQDEIAVCCHDASFTDSTTGETIVIANHTYEELLTYNYHHETIASLDDVIKTCKFYGLRLQLDHTSVWDTSKWDKIFAIVRKYNMLEKIYFTCGDSAVYNILHSYYADVNIMASFAAPTDAQIELCNSWKTDKNHVCVAIHYTEKTVNEIIEIRSKLKDGMEICVWTIDNKDIYLQYLPYVDNISSNKISEYMIWQDELNDL